MEQVFANAKQKHSMRYKYHKSLAKVTNWIRLEFAAMNLKKMVTWRFKSACVFIKNTSNKFEIQNTPIFRFENGVTPRARHPFMWYFFMFLER
ncbi:transposase [Anaerotignum neopropionicum]|uniref:transposase n=1 Tax=Anaerotignum neopropionicum TaxID=36847 RepID=UPI0038BA7448